MFMISNDVCIGDCRSVGCIGSAVLQRCGNAAESEGHTVINDWITAANTQMSKCVP
jgi:hypothetical protein